MPKKEELDRAVSQNEDSSFTPTKGLTFIDRDRNYSPKKEDSLVQYIYQTGIDNYPERVIKNEHVCSIDMINRGEAVTSMD